MLTFEELRKAVGAAPLVVEFHGQQVRIGRIDARRGLALVREIQRNAPSGKAEDADLVPVLVECAALAVEDEAGAKILDSAEGREWLAGLPLADLVALGQPALRHNGLQGNPEGNVRPTP